MAGGGAVAPAGAGVVVAGAGVVVAGAGVVVAGAGVVVAGLEERPGMPAGSGPAAGAGAGAAPAGAASGGGAAVAGAVAGIGAGAGATAGAAPGAGAGGGGATGPVSGAAGAAAAGLTGYSYVVDLIVTAGKRHPSRPMRVGALRFIGRVKIEAIGRCLTRRKRAGQGHQGGEKGGGNLFHTGHGNKFTPRCQRASPGFFSIDSALRPAHDPAQFFARLV